MDGTSREEQDFVLIDSEVFFAPDAKTVLEFMKARVASAAKPAVMEEVRPQPPSDHGPPRDVIEDDFFAPGDALLEHRAVQAG